jgi:hypothetical protein
MNQLAVWYVVNTFTRGTLLSSQHIAAYILTHFVSEMFFTSFLNILDSHFLELVEWNKLTRANTKVFLSFSCNFRGQLLNNKLLNLVPRLFPLVEERPWLGLVTWHADSAC